MQRLLRLPANLNLQELNTLLNNIEGLAKPEKEINGLTRRTRGVIFLYNYILTRDINRHQGEFAYDYTQVGREVMWAFLNVKEYQDILKTLIAKNYLERLDYNEDGEYYEDGYYQIADEEAGIVGRCKSFRVPVALQSETKQYQRYPLVLTKTDLNKIENVKAGRVEYEEPYRDFIRQNMENIALVDTNESRQAISQLYAQQSLRVDAERFIDMWNNALMHDISVDSFGHRVHGPLTSAPKELRQYMRFKSDMESPLVEIDFVASQPSLLASITPHIILKFVPECLAAIGLFEAVQGNADWEAYKAACLDTREGHGIYELLAQEFEKAYGVPMDRNDGKNVFYRASFSNYRAVAKYTHEYCLAELDWHMLNGTDKSRQEAADNLLTHRSYHVFKSLFPRVHKLFKDLKSLKWDIVGQGAKHANNCLLAQRVESGLMYTVLVKALKAAGITKVVTIHDAVFIRQEDEPKARKIIQKELDKLKLNLRLKTK